MDTAAVQVLTKVDAISILTGAQTHAAGFAFDGRGQKLLPGKPEMGPQAFNVLLGKDDSALALAAVTATTAFKRQNFFRHWS